MNIMILSDLEGIKGVNSIVAIDRTSQDYADACVRLTEALNRLAELCRQNGGEAIYYLDGHGGGGNVLLPQVVPYLQKVSISEWQTLLQAGKIDCQIELGAHARAGTIGGFLDHTISSKQWFCHRVNGKESSELSMHAQLCGAYGVPIVLCIGDDAACEQAKEYIPQIYTVAVKHAECRNLCTDYEDADERLISGVKAALEHYRSIPPMKTECPITVELTFYRTDYCEEALAHSGASTERVNARTLRKTLPELRNYEDLRF